MSLESITTLPKAETIAEGKPIERELVCTAVDWLTRVMDEQSKPEDIAALDKWRTLHPDNDRAWRHVRTLSERLQLLHGTSARKSLSKLPSTNRRRTLAALLIIGGGASFAGVRSEAWQQATADYRTSVGSIKHISLPDGTALVLNTHSAVNIQFDDSQRLLQLVSGEILITTGHIPSRYQSMPLTVQTKHGIVQPIGTHFAVRDHGNFCTVEVSEGAVRVAPEGKPGQGGVVNAGQFARFTQSALDTIAPLNDGFASWVNAELYADNIRLADFLEELGRYRQGFMYCNQSVADLRLSGIFPLNDTDRILRLLAHSLPIRVRYRTRYWVSVEAAT